MKANLSTDDYVPRFFNAGLLADLEEYVSTPREFDTIEDWFVSKGYPATWEQIKQFLADVEEKGELTIITISGDSLPDPITRPVPVTGLGCTTSMVWFGSYGGQAWGEGHNTGTFRFYNNGILKYVATDNYIIDLATLEATTGDVISICQVVGGVVGWWNSITVPA